MKTLIAVAFLFLSLSSFAQSSYFLGIQANPVQVLPKEYYTLPAVSSENLDVESVFSYTAGLKFDYYWDKGLGINTGLRYTHKKYDLSFSFYYPLNTKEYTYGGRYESGIHALELPLLLAYKIPAGENSSVILNLGGSADLQNFIQPYVAPYVSVIEAGFEAPYGASFHANAIAGVGFLMKTESCGHFRLGYSYNKALLPSSTFHVPVKLDNQNAVVVFHPMLDYFSYEFAWYFVAREREHTQKKEWREILPGTPEF